MKISKSLQTARKGYKPFSQGDIIRKDGKLYKVIRVVPYPNDNLSGSFFYVRDKRGSGTIVFYHDWLGSATLHRSAKEQKAKTRNLLDKMFEGLKNEYKDKTIVGDGVRANRRKTIKKLFNF